MSIHYSIGTFDYNAKIFWGLFGNELNFIRLFFLCLPVYLCALMLWAVLIRLDPFQMILFVSKFIHCVEKVKC